MVKKYTKRELLEHAVGTGASNRIQEKWRSELRWYRIPVKKMIFFGLLGLFMLGYGVADLSGPWMTVQQGSAGVGVFLMLAVAYVGRKHVLKGVREALFEHLKEERTKVSWYTHGVELFPRELLEREKAVVQNIGFLDENARRFVNGLWGNMLFFVPSRVDLYLLDVMASYDMKTLERNAAYHVDNVKELVKMIEEARTHSNVVALRRGGGVETVF